MKCPVCTTLIGEIQSCSSPCPHRNASLSGQRQSHCPPGACTAGIARSPQNSYRGCTADLTLRQVTHSSSSSPSSPEPAWDANSAADCQSKTRHLTHFCGCGFCCENKTKKSPGKPRGRRGGEQTKSPWLVGLERPDFPTASTQSKNFVLKSAITGFSSGHFSCSSVRC